MPQPKDSAPHLGHHCWDNGQILSLFSKKTSQFKLRFEQHGQKRLEPYVEWMSASMYKVLCRMATIGHNGNQAHGDIIKVTHTPSEIIQYIIWYLYIDLFLPELKSKPYFFTLQTLHSYF